MFATLLLTLLKDLRTTIRARWYILAVEIIFNLLFIPVVWGMLGQFVGKKDSSGTYGDYVRTQFLNGTDDLLTINVIYFSNPNELDITSLETNVKAFCHADLKIYNKDGPTNSYVQLNSLSETEIDYEVVYTTYSSDYTLGTSFYPNPVGDTFTSISGIASPENAFAQYCINVAFYGGVSPLRLPKIMNVPQPKYLKDVLTTGVQIVHYLICPLIMIPCIFFIKDVMREKENGVHTYMIVMGLPRYIYYLSQFIFATLKTYAFVLPAGAAFVVFVPSGWWYYVNLILFSHVAIAWAMLSSTLFVTGTYAMMFSFAMLGLSILLHFVVVDPYAGMFHQPGWSLACSILNPFSAFTFARDHVTFSMNFGVPYRYTESWPYYLPMIVPVVSLFVQAVFYTLLSFYCDYVLPIDSSPKKHPLFIFGRREARESLSDEEAKELALEKKGSFKDYFEREPKGTADIEVTQLVKKWPNGEVAVRHISFKAYRGQVTALLGHNGAGKSTVFGCLTGFIAPTAGHIKVGSAGGEKIGYCPQWNPLFPLLTVEEHLQFYGAMKTGSRVKKAEIDDVLQQIDLEYARNYRAMNLSGGMMRKLCVGMAMVGNSRVLLLDEPTAGMDPLARRGVLDIVEKVKANRTVLLTTHYMDEADLLSDRIIIMAKGELICNGSSNFLKSRFGVGFVLTVALKVDAKQTEELKEKADSILAIVKEFCKGAKLEGLVTPQFKMVLPHGTQREFPRLFEELELKKRALRIGSFGVGVNNLEQVFIKVTDFADNIGSLNANEDVRELITIRAKRYSGLRLLANQYGALIARKWHYMKRHYVKSLLPVVLLLPLLGLCIKVAVSSSTETMTSSRDVLDFNPDEFPKTLVPFVFDSSNDAFTSSLKKCMNEIENAQVAEWTSNGSLFYRQQFMDAQKELPPLGFGFSYVTNQLIIYVRQVFPGSSALAAHALSRPFASDSKSVKVKLVLEKNEFHDHDSTASTFHQIIAILSALVYPIVCATPIFLYITERHGGTLHLYRLTQMSQVTYWVAAYLTDFVICLFYIVLIMAILFAFQIFHTDCMLGYFVASIAVCFSLISQSYFVTFIFPNANMALGVLQAFNILIGLTAFGITAVIHGSAQTIYMMVTDVIFPMKALISVTVTLVFSCYVGKAPDEDHKFAPEHIFEICTGLYKCSGSAIYGSFAMGLTFVVLMFIMTVWRTVKMMTSIGHKYTGPTDEDEDVRNERVKVEKAKKKKDFAICTKNLRKKYKTGVVAVRNLTLGIPPGECFGLLGVNGAGKSTTFNMLTGNLRPSSGSGYVNRVRIDGQAKFGFCPQHDTILQELTIHETMLLFARLNGLVHGRKCVDLLLHLLQLKHRANNLIKNCSGGEKRRLSIGVALITNCDVIMLDEPTAGVDPRTRRQVWDILIGMRNVGTSQVLSSHSMEECEALCTRIGFLNHGVLQGIGNSQHLKQRFGNNYMLTLTLTSSDELLAEQFNRAVKTEFEGTPMVNGFHATTLSWTVPKHFSSKWSEIYRQVVQFVDRWKHSDGRAIIDDFALVESSLEQVFVALSRNTGAPNVA